MQPEEANDMDTTIGTREEWLVARKERL